MRTLRFTLALAAAAALSACHLAGHLPPGQVKKAIDPPPGQAKKYDDD